VEKEKIRKRMKRKKTKGPEEDERRKNIACRNEDSEDWLVNIESVMRVDYLLTHEYPLPDEERILDGVGGSGRRVFCVRRYNIHEDKK